MACHIRPERHIALLNSIRMRERVRVLEGARPILVFELFVSVSLTRQKGTRDKQREMNGKSTHRIFSLIELGKE